MSTTSFSRSLYVSITAEISTTYIDNGGDVASALFYFCVVCAHIRIRVPLLCHHTFSLETSAFLARPFLFLRNVLRF